MGCLGPLAIGAYWFENAVSNLLHILKCLEQFFSSCRLSFLPKMSITSAEAKLPPSERANAESMRSLRSVAEKLAKFNDAGGMLEKAKYCNNVIAPAFFDIPLEKVRCCVIFR